jgi:hypothetical protein
MDFRELYEKAMKDCFSAKADRKIRLLTKLYRKK